MKVIKNPELLDVKILKKNVSSFNVELEKGDEVQIIYIGNRGYGIMHVDSGNAVYECGWDIFEDQHRE